MANTLVIPYSSRKRKWNNAHSRYFTKVWVVWTCEHVQPKRGRQNSESWPRAGNPGRDLRKTDCIGNIDTSAMDRALFHWYWKMNWNWCFHSSAAGRVSSEEGNFDQLTNQTMPQIFEWKIGQQKGKSQKAESWKLPLFLLCLNVIVKWIRRRGALLAKEPLPHSGAQSASRWIPWISTGYGLTM